MNSVQIHVNWNEGHLFGPDKNWTKCCTVHCKTKHGPERRAALRLKWNPQTGLKENDATDFNMNWFIFCISFVTKYERKNGKKCI